MFEASEPLLAVLAESQRCGAIGPAPLPDHISHAAGFATAWIDEPHPPRRALDLGSGGGLPGLVLAELDQDLDLTLLDGRLQRAKLLEDAIVTLALGDRVRVLAGRAEELARREDLRSSFDLVAARGFAIPAVTAECAAGFLRVGGMLVVSEPPTTTTTDDRWPADGCRILGLELERRISAPFGFVVLRQALPCPPRFPRRVGVPTKRPLF